VPLFRSKTDVELSLDRTDLLPGDTVAATVTLSEPDKKAQGGRVELFYRNTYKEVDYDRDADGDTDRRVRTKTAEIPVASAPLFGAGEPASGSYSVELELPTGAPATAPDLVEYAVRAVLDRKGGFDAKDEAPVTVHAPAETHADWARRPAELTTTALGMAMEIEPRIVRPGDVIRGSFTLTPTSPVEARSLRAQLEWRRRDRDGLESHGTASRIELGGDETLAPGQTRELPFELVVPQDAAPCFQTPNNELHWVVEGVVDRKMREDHVIALEVAVHTA